MAMKSRCDARNELSHAGREAVIERLSASIAHEVAQPISAALINAETALHRLSAQQPDLAEARLALGRVIRDANRASEVVSAIRALHKREPLRCEGLQINQAVLAVLDLTKDEARRNGVSVRTYLAKSLPPIQGDRIQLQQVILNLINNGVDAMRPGRQGSRELLISTGRAGSHSVLVRVRDSGPGLAPASLERVFQPFYTTKRSGMGMGLSICRSIVEAHGGRLWATANVPCGAVFQFALPSLPAMHGDPFPLQADAPVAPRAFKDRRWGTRQARPLTY
jgi:signal transduction histidine kinase